MLIGEVVKSVVSLRETNVRKLADKAGLSYQSIYESCNGKTKKGMHTTTATKLLDALDYQLVAMPKGVELEDEWLKVDDKSEGVRKITQTCIICGKHIPKSEYSQFTPKGRVCQKCINEKFAADTD